MTNENIAAFLAIAKTNSFSLAATHLLTTKQVVSKAIQALEEDLGTQLVLRDTRTVSLTEAGRLFQKFFEDQAHALERQACNLPGCGEKRIYLGIDEWLGCPPELVQKLNEYKKKTGTSIYVVHSEGGSGITMLLAQKVDVLLTTRYSVRQRENVVNSRFFGEVALHVISHPCHPFATAPRIKSFPNLPILSSIGGEDTFEQARVRDVDLCNKCGLTPKSITVFPSLTTAMANVALCSGVSILPARPQTEEFAQIPTGTSVTAMLCVRKDADFEGIAALFEILSDLTEGGAKSNA